MITPQKILCIVDPTAETHPVVERAAWLAQHTGASIELRICFYDQILSGGRVFDSRSLQRARAELIEAQQESLEEIVKDLTGAGLTSAASVAWDHPLHDAIVRSAIDADADFVMKDTHRHDDFALSTLTNTDWNLIRTCPIPLWLVKPGSKMSPLKIIAAVDPTNEHDKPAELDDRIVQLSNAIAKEADAELHLFHVVHRPSTLVRTSPDTVESTFLFDSDVIARRRAFHRRSFDELADKHDVADDCRHFMDGNVHEVLPNLATDLNAGLVVMGAVARNRLKRIFIGSTAERTLDRLPADLLIVKPSGFETPVRLERTDHP